MVSGRLRSHRFIYLLCAALLVVAMSGTSKVAQAAGVTISISGVNSVTTSCANGSVSVHYTVSVNVPTGSDLDLWASVVVPGFGSSTFASSLFGTANATIHGPFNSSGNTSVGRTFSPLPPNSIFTITYFNSIGSGSASFQVNCSTGLVTGITSSSAFNITHFDPADGRIDGQPGDRIVIYCNPTATPPSIDIYGITDDGLGYLLGRFKFNLVVRAGKNGVVLRPVGKGKIYLQVDANNNFYAAWNGGPYNATGMGDFAKSFACPFKR